MSSDVKRKGLLLCLVGIVGSGKTSLGAQLVKEFSPALKLSVSATSRRPREGEVEGESYYFLSREEFENRASRGEFFEWEETHGNLYGTLKASIEEAIANGHDLLLDVDIRGALNFKSQYPEVTEVVFIVPPSYEELVRRIKGRGEVSEEDLCIRFATAKLEMNAFTDDVRGPGRIRYVLENDSFAESYEQLRSVYLAERLVARRVSDRKISEFGEVCNRGK